MKSVASVLGLRRLLRGRPSKIVGAVDVPGAHESYAEAVDIEGWALALDGRPLDIVVDVDGRTVCAAAPRVERPDIRALYRQVSARRSGASLPGFRLRLERAQLPDRAQAELVIKAVTPHRPDNTQVIGTSILVREALPEPAPEMVAAPGPSAPKTAGSAAAARAPESTWRDKRRRAADVIAANVRASASVAATDVVLEIGCGTGDVGLYLAPHCAQWIGADSSASLIRSAKISLTELPNARVVTLDEVNSVELVNGSVDVVYCTNLFMHLDEWARFRCIAEASRVLRPGGRIHLENLNLMSDEGWQLFAGGLATGRRQEGPMPRPSTPQELETYLTRAGFEAIEVRADGPWLAVRARTPGPTA